MLNLGKSNQPILISAEVEHLKEKKNHTKRNFNFYFPHSLIVYLLNTNITKTKFPRTGQNTVRSLLQVEDLASS